MLGVCGRAYVLDEGLCGVNVFVTVILWATECLRERERFCADI